MARRTRIATAALALGIAPLAAASPAGAHTSSYCGHGTSGNLDITKWEWHQSSMSYPYHYNHSRHFTITNRGTYIATHSAMRACPGGQ